MGFRSKLIISFAAVIIFTLVLALLFFSYVVGRIQDDASKKATDRLQAITINASNAIVAQSAYSNSFDELQANLESIAQLLDVRMLLVDGSGLVRADSDTSVSGSMKNEVIPNYQLTPRDGKAYSHTAPLRDVQYFYFTRPGPTFKVTSASGNNTGSAVVQVSFKFQDVEGQGFGTILQTDLWLAVPLSEINTDWRDIAKGLLAAAGLALLLAVGLAFLLARGIARPLLRITRASTEIAQGNYGQQLPIEGWGEMARLATSFNRMSREVDRSQRTMRDFVANVSHELKTPLTSIQGYSQAILEGVADDPTAIDHSASVIYGEAARMRRLVDELLDLSRVESGQVALVRREVDLRQVLNRVVVRLEPQATDKGLQFQARMDPYQPLLVAGDGDRLEQIFTNILDNAVKYSLPDALVSLGVDYNPGSGEMPNGNGNGRGGRGAIPPTIRVVVSNLGALIPEEQLPRVFERFYKLDPSRKRKGESTGLGLAITRELVEAHGGSINVTSQPTGQPGEGLTTFTIILPAMPVRGYDPAPPNTRSLTLPGK
jgi:signal transduction histidine kinase